MTATRLVEEKRPDQDDTFRIVEQRRKTRTADTGRHAAPQRTDVMAHEETLR